MIDIPGPIFKDKPAVLSPDIIRVGIGKPELPKPSKESPVSSIDSYIDGEGNILIAPLELLAKKVKPEKNGSSQNPAAREQQTIIDTANNLKQHLKSLESLEVIDALSTIDSPWNDVVDRMVLNDSLKQTIPDETTRRIYAEKLLFPLGANLYGDIRKMTSDPLQRQLMFQCIAENLNSNNALVRPFEQHVPNITNAASDTDTMKRAFVESTGGIHTTTASQKEIDALYSQALHKTVLQSRLESEQPLFTITQYEKELKKQTDDLKNTVMPFAREELTQSIRETQNELIDMKKLRSVIDMLLPAVIDEPSLLKGLDEIQNKRFDGVIGDEIPPHHFEPWVPENIGEKARKQLVSISTPNEDLAAKTLKGIGWVEQKMKNQDSNQQDTWGDKQYTRHMEWLKDPLAQAKRKQIILNIVDLTMTLTTLAAGVSGGIQRQIEGPSVPTIQDIIDNANSQKPWEAAADLATPKNRREIINN